jgi:hypothetical protein
VKTFKGSSFSHQSFVLLMVTFNKERQSISLGIQKKVFGGNSIFDFYFRMEFNIRFCHRRSTEGIIIRENLRFICNSRIAPEITCFDSKPIRILVKAPNDEEAFLADARQRRDEARKQIAHGIDPGSLRKA